VVPHQSDCLSKYFAILHRRYARQEILGCWTTPLIDRLRTHEIITDWDAYLADEEDATAIEGMRSQTGTGRPDGDDEFLKLLESQTGRRVRKRRAGRKKK